MKKVDTDAHSKSTKTNVCHTVHYEYICRISCVFLNRSALFGCDTQYICTCILLLEHQTSVLIKYTVACSRWTRTHTRTKKNNEIPPELSHTATTLGELGKE